VGSFKPPKVRTTARLEGSIRSSDCSAELTTQIAPSPAAIASGALPTRTAPTTVFVRGSITPTAFAGTTTGAGPDPLSTS
jgi:hypothetical protein